MTEETIQFGQAPTPDDSRFLTNNTLEIVRTLRGLRNRNEMVSAFFNAGHDLLLTSVVDVQPDHNAVFLDYGSNDALNKQILQADKIIFVTSLDSVKVQWISNDIATGTFEARDAFRITLPKQMLRLQRRECYRLNTPLANPLKCHIPSGNDTSIEAVLVDISAGGIGIIIPPSTENVLLPGTLFPGCCIELPGIGRAEFTISVQSTWQVTMKNGHKNMRAGCQFIDMRPGIQSLVQRYIIKLERERLANTPGH